MAVSHVKSVTIADFTGTVTVYDSRGSTVTAAATDIVRPSDYNSVHNQFVTLRGNTLGASTLSGTNIELEGGPNVTLSVNGGTRVVFSGGAGAAGNTGYISAGTATASLGTVVFSNSNGVSFGVDGQTVTASHNGLTSQSNQAVSAANGSVAFQTVSFSNANGVSFATAAGPAIVASVAAQTVQPGIASVSAGTTRVTTGEVVFSNSNGVSFGADGQTVTASIATSLTNIRVSGGTTSNLLSAITFADGNNVSFGLNASTMTASVATSLTNIRVSAGTTSNLLSALTLADGNGISFGLNASTITASYTVPTVPAQLSVGNSNLGNTAGDTGVFTGRVVLVGSNNITLSGSSNAGSATISIIGGAGGAGFSAGVSTGGNTAGDTGVTGTRLVLAGGNNVTVSQGTDANGATVTISGANTVAQSNQTVGLYALGNTTQNSSTTLDARTISLNGLGGITVGYSNGSVQISGPQTVAQSVQTIGAYAVGNTTGESSSTTWDARTVSVRGDGIISVGYSNSSLRISATQSAQTIGVYASSNTTAQSSSSTVDARSLTFRGMGIASVGMSAGEVILSVPAGGGAGDGGVFAGVSTGGNTAGSTGTVSTGNFVLVGSGPISLSQSTGAAGSAATVSIIGPATSSLVGVSGLSVSTNGSTISVYPQALSRSLLGDGVSQGGAAQANSIVSVRPFIIDWPLAFSNVMVGGSVSLATVANTSSAYLDVSVSAVLYSRNANTLSSILSGSTSYSAFAQSNSTGSLTGPQAFVFTVAATTLPPGEYWWALHVSTTNTGTGANTTALGRTISMIVADSGGSAAHGLRVFGANTNNSQGAIIGMGAISTDATRATIAFSDITQTGTRAANAHLFYEMRNHTVW